MCRKTRMAPLLSAAMLAGWTLAGCVGQHGWFWTPGFPDIDGDSDTFVLDWTGGRNPLHPDELPPLDLAAFDVSGGGTLADVEGFHEMVRRQVEIILRDAGINSTVVTGEQRTDANNVHISPEAVDSDGDQVLGRGHYDPCNRRHRDSCIVYAQAIIDDDMTCSVRQWTNVFANIAAHEIGHNLGFDHPEAADVPAWTGYAELMLASQPWSARKREQRFLVEQDTCPDLSDAKYVPISMPLDPPPE